ncbi:hypothetical protein BN946_scf184783.g2 [Trametes cinnabarina]|uniref:Uncharacterized protein n=1 Tax=Pycnoporus cinnabarinus TaxID=5643 RepID=A0A060SCK3_PYCCI|nr:hypothetical protein BN946_scf184783.g2 [Trametes cinnabarina]
MLRYKIQLGMNGLRDGRAGAVGVVERLEKLEAYLARWRDFDFHSDLTQHPKRGFQSYRMQHTSDGSILYRVYKSFKDAVVFSPPSMIRGVEKHIWITPLNRFDKVCALASDATQDLLVVAERTNMESSKLHFLSLRQSGEPHLDAAGSIMLSPTPGVCCYRDSTSELAVWDWREGEILWRLKLGKRVNYTIIDSSHLALASEVFGNHARIEIYRIPSSRDAVDIEGVPPKPICALQLPVPAHSKEGSIFLSSVSCNAPCATTTFSEEPFTLDPDHAVLAINFSILTRSPRYEHQYVLLVPLRTIRKEIRHALACDAEKPSIAVPWEDWGWGAVVLPLPSMDSLRERPSVPQCMPASDSLGSHEDLHPEPLGHRYMLLRPSPDGAISLEGGVVLEAMLLDFSQHHTTDNRPSTTSIVSEFANTKADQVFPPSVFETRLSYRATLGRISISSSVLPRVSQIVLQPDGFTAIYMHSVLRPKFLTYYV